MNISDLVFTLKLQYVLWTWSTPENPGHSKFIDDTMICDTKITVCVILDGCLEIDL